MRLAAAVRAVRLLSGKWPSFLFIAHAFVISFIEQKKKSQLWDSGMKHPTRKVLAVSPVYVEGWSRGQKKSRPAPPEQLILTFVLISSLTPSLPHGFLCQVGCQL